VPGSVEPMLPLELSADACSLKPGEVRRVVSLEVRIGADGKPGAPHVRRALIRSRARFSYDDAQEVLAGRLHHPQGDLLARADALASDLRARRHARGAFTLASRELSFEVDDGRVVDARWDEEPRAHVLVEELMLLANEAVGGLLARARRPAIYRVHEHPKREALLALADRLSALGLPVVPLPERADGPAASRAVARQAELLEPIMRERPATREAFGTLLLRTLEMARYDTVNIGHAALASPAYVHFTSPIRRYPDIVVHRAICALAGLGEDAPKARDLPEVALRCSLREREAESAERRAESICLAFLLRDRLRRDGWHQTFEGVVIGLIGAGLFLRFGDVFEGFLPARRLDPRERFDVDEHGVALVGRASGRRIRLGDELSCVVTAIDPPRGRATLDLVPEDGAPSSRTRPAKRTTPRRPPKATKRKPPIRRKRT
jgi:ribonuclease R